MADTSTADGLPADLQAALDHAQRLAHTAGYVVMCGRLGLGERVYLASVREMRDTALCRDTINRVKTDLVCASELTERFGATCAHAAAIELFVGVWITLHDGVCDEHNGGEPAPVVGYNQWCVVAQAVTFPDARAICVACEREAHLAFANRPLEKEPGPKPLPAADSGPQHAADFCWVKCPLGEFTFSGAQRAVVKALWKDWEHGGRGLSQTHLIDAAGSDNGTELRSLFKNDPAWGLLIVKAPERRDMFRLALPPSATDPK